MIDQVRDTCTVKNKNKNREEEKNPGFDTRVLKTFLKFIFSVHLRCDILNFILGHD